MLNTTPCMAQSTKTIVCLANSRKAGGRCVAGFNLLNGSRQGDWIRPISDRLKGELSRREQAYDDNNEPALLDVIDIPLKAAKPSAYQRENWVIEPGIRWHKSGHYDRKYLRTLAVKKGPLWINGSSSRDGENDYVPIDETKGFSPTKATVEDLVVKKKYEK